MTERQLDKKLKRYLEKSLNAEYKSLKNKYRDRWVIGTGTLSAMQKTDEEQRHRIAVLERALKLACEELRMPYRNDGKTKIITYTKDTQIIESLPDYFIDQAEKELNNGLFKTNI